MISCQLPFSPIWINFNNLLAQNEDEDDEEIEDEDDDDNVNDIDDQSDQKISPTPHQLFFPEGPRFILYEGSIYCSLISLDDFWLERDLTTFPVFSEFRSITVFMQMGGCGKTFLMHLFLYM